VHPVHLTEKPVALAVRSLQYSSRPGEDVLDLFGGSGTTLIAAEQTGRRAFLMEMDALYCDVIVQRWERFTGKKAQRHTATSQAAQRSKRRGSRRRSVMPRMRTQSDRELLKALACGAIVENAARKAGICERTVYRRLANPAFRRQVNLLRTEMVQRTTGM